MPRDARDLHRRATLNAGFGVQSDAAERQNTTSMRANACFSYENGFSAE